MQCNFFLGYNRATVLNTGTGQSFETEDLEYMGTYEVGDPPPPVWFLPDSPPRPSVARQVAGATPKLPGRPWEFERRDLLDPTFGHKIIGYVMKRGHNL